MIPSPAVALLAAALVVQQQPAPASSATPPLTPPPATAVLAEEPPTIDGRDTDAVWRRAPRYAQFRQFEPRVDADPIYRTEFAVAYDERNLYVFVRMFDPHPDSIMHALTRRDVRGPSDQIKLLIDSYHDRRSGYEFAVNPDGVKRDYSMANDGQEDDSWNGVWDVATTVDSLGWTAEFHIPLSQMRKTIAKRLAQSIGPVPHFFLTVEVDMTEAMAFRKKINERFSDEGVKVSPTMVYYIRSKQHQARQRAKRERVAESSRQSGVANPVEIVLRVKDLAREVGGIAHLKQLVDLLAE